MAIAYLSGPQDPSQINATINSLIKSINTNAGVAKEAYYAAPIAAELISVKAAATPSNGTITIAAQPDYPRKLQIRIVIGTTTTTAITAGTLTLVGTDVHGNTITEVVSLIAATSVTLQSFNAYAHLTSGTVAAYAASGSGTGNTLGIGVSAQLGLPCAPGSPLAGGTNGVTSVANTSGGVSGLTVFKANVDAADEAVGTVDGAAGTISPTTAPNASHNYFFFYTANLQE